MIRTYFGISQNPFATDSRTPLLDHQQRHFDILKVHSQQGGLCVILGDPGTGKTVLKNAIIHHNQKEWITPVINRSLHTWHNMLRLLCHAFELDTQGSDHKCEQRLINEAKSLNAKGKLIIPIIDDAHLVPIDALAARARPHTPERYEGGADGGHKGGTTAERRRSVGRRGRDDRRQHNEGSGRGERLACEERAARADRRGLATAPRTTSARAEARPVRGAHFF